MNPAIPYQLDTGTGIHSFPGFPVSLTSTLSLTSAVAKSQKVGSMEELLGKTGSLTSSSYMSETHSKNINFGGKRKGHTCEICGKNFRQKPVLKTHMKIHADTKDHFCPECGRGFTYKANMDVHMRVHSGEKPHECSHCGKRFSQSNSLKYHISTHTGYKPFICPVCNKTFVTKGNLRDHMITHSSDRPFKCDVCGHNFARKVSLNTHYRSHFELQPIKCRVCRRSFPNNSALLLHKCGLHSKEHKHNNIIEKKKSDEDFDLLVENDLLDEEQSNSLTSKNFEPKFHTCATCGKSFKSKSMFLTHKEVCFHSRNSDRYECSDCHMIFNDVASLNQHKSLHTMSNHLTKDKNCTTPTMSSSNSLLCSVCNVLFFDKDKLLEHYQQHLNSVFKK